MKIIKIETISLAEFPNVIWIQVHTDAGHVGLGETFFGSQAIHAYVHETLAPQMLGQDALRIEQHSRKLMQNYVGFKSTGAEIRGASAFDIALWDILGQVAGMPLYQLLGGKCRDRIRVYNTCAGYRYVRAKANWGTNDWGLENSEGPYEDLDAFLNRADDLAESLIAEGYTGMKIWPFDHAADKTGGNDISPADLKKGMLPFEKIRKRVGDKIDLHVEMHGLWNLPTAMKIARAMEPLEPYWFEEQATSVAMLDIGWCGGLSEAKKIATMAESYEIPVAPHDCTGPVLLTASVHLAIASPNALVQEVVRAFYFGWYGEMVENLPPLANGFIAPTEAPGLGVKLKQGLRDRPDAMVKVSAR